MKVLALDTETSIYNKGNLHDSRNELVCWSWCTNTKNDAAYWDDQARIDIQEWLGEIDLIVGFNFKFDYGWLKKYGVDFTGVKIWDVQIAEFILSYQLNRFPSLNDTCIKYGIPVKLDVVKTEYWEKGIQTRDIPWEILREYAAHDAKVTLLCYYEQIKLMTPAQIKLCKLMCQDLVVLQEMENNGITLDVSLCETRSEEITTEAKLLEQKLHQFYPDVPINFGSNDDLSAFLYGGTIVEEIRVHDGFYKTGLKAGQPKLKKQEITHTLPRLFEPIKGSEMAKEGNYSVAEDTLRKLKGKHKHLIESLLRLAKLEKLNGTYYKGLPNLIAEMHWSNNKLHGQLNQTLARTGRLSSSKP